MKKETMSESLGVSDTYDFKRSKMNSGRLYTDKQFYKNGTLNIRHKLVLSLWR